MSEKLKDLTPEQNALLEVYRENWLNKIFKYELFNSMTQEATEIAAKKLYKFCGFEEPKVLLLDSPMACQETLHKLKHGDNAANVPIAFEPFGSYVNYTDFGWVAFYDFFINECGVLLEFKDQIEMMKEFLNNGFTQIQMDEYCLVSKYPNFISRDADKNLHNIERSAISFVDGYEQHYFRGIYMTSELFDKLINKQYTFEEFTQETNEETKSLVLAFYEEKFGGEFLFRFLSEHLKEIDTYVDKKDPKFLEKTTGGMNIGVYTLFKGSVNGINIAYVRCFCPSTDRMFFLGVHPSFTNAKDAIASLCQIPQKLSGHLLSIRRQGEIFSFNFDDYGTELLKNQMLTEADYSEATSLTGDEYFSKLEFEY
jgi:hypothetical protein